MLMSHNLLHILVKIFALVFSVFIIQCLSRHEQVCLTRLPFERYFSYHRAWWREKYLSTSSLIKDAYSWRDKLLYIVAYTEHIKLQQEITSHATLKKIIWSSRPNEVIAHSSWWKPRTVDNSVPPGVVATGSYIIISMIGFDSFRKLVERNLG